MDYSENPTLEYTGKLRWCGASLQQEVCDCIYRAEVGMNGECHPVKIKSNLRWIDVPRTIDVSKEGS